MPWIAKGWKKFPDISPFEPSSPTLTI